MPVFTTRDNQLMHYQAIGKGAPVVMLHGVGMEGRHWLPVILPLIKHYRFYLLDLRGFGKSSETPINQEDVFVNLAEDVQDFIEELQLKHFYLVGYSLGGSVALQLQKKIGFDKVRAYLHIDQSPCIRNKKDWKYGIQGYDQTAFLLRLQQLYDMVTPYTDAQSLQDLPTKTKKAVVKEFGEVLSIAAGNPVISKLLKQAVRFPGLFAKLVPLPSMHNLKAYLYHYANSESDLRECFENSEAPITLFVGQNSSLYSPMGQLQMAEKAAVKRSTVFSRSGHMPLADEPIKFVKELKRFLREN